ncbi:MAG: ATP-binding cassette domain-containing protein [Deltaproteobacteria bacterium]|nr:ATP-binding cassette domain-containing protein [Deltaproteobacteria bacterium]
MIRIENISKNLGEFFLNDVTLDIEKGEYFVVLGPTGAGKTILLEAIAGIYSPDRGKILMDGRDITNVPPRSRNISMVYQDYMLFPHLTVEKNISFGLKLKKIPTKEIKKKIDGISRMLNVRHLFHRFPGTLSGGEKQRIAIARAVVTEPKALLLDEPLSALDAQTREGLRYELKKIHSVTGITIIHVTHNFEEVFSLGDSVAVMNEGKIIQVGNPDDVFRRPNCEFIANFVGVENLFKGRSTVNNGTSDITINGIKIASTACNSGDSVVSIRPEDILVSRNKIESSARNSFSGKITGVIDKGAIIKIVADCGIPISAIITRRSFDDMGLSRGMSAYFTFKASDVHFI